MVNIAERIMGVNINEALIDRLFKSIRLQLDDVERALSKNQFDSALATIKSIKQDVGSVEKDIKLLKKTS